MGPSSGTPLAILKMQRASRWWANSYAYNTKGVGGAGEIPFHTEANTKHNRQTGEVDLSDSDHEISYSLEYNLVGIST